MECSPFGYVSALVVLAVGISGLLLHGFWFATWIAPRVRSRFASKYLDARAIRRLILAPDTAKARWCNNCREIFLEIPGRARERLVKSSNRDCIMPANHVGTANECLRAFNVPADSIDATIHFAWAHHRRWWRRWRKWLRPKEAMAE